MRVVGWCEERFAWKVIAASCCCCCHPTDASTCPLHLAPYRAVPHQAQETGLEQYAIMKYAEALEVVPRTIAENSGLDATEVLAALFAARTAGQTTAGLDVETGARDSGVVLCPGGRSCCDLQACFSVCVMNMHSLWPTLT